MILNPEIYNSAQWRGYRWGLLVGVVVGVIGSLVFLAPKLCKAMEVL